MTSREIKIEDDVQVVGVPNSRSWLGLTQGGLNSSVLNIEFRKSHTIKRDSIIVGQLFN
jgi:hypothetical protein